MTFRVNSLVMTSARLLFLKLTLEMLRAVPFPDSIEQVRCCNSTPQEQTTLPGAITFSIRNE